MKPLEIWFAEVERRLSLWPSEMPRLGVAKIELFPSRMEPGRYSPLAGMPLASVPVGSAEGLTVGPTAVVEPPPVLIAPEFVAGAGAADGATFCAKAICPMTASAALTAAAEMLFFIGSFLVVRRNNFTYL